MENITAVIGKEEHQIKSSFRIILFFPLDFFVIIVYNSSVLMSLLI
jgi:hypothetical protein